MSGRTHILEGDPPVEVEIARSPRARRLSLRVSRSTGRVRLTILQFAPEAEAMGFLQARASWLRRHLAEVPDLKRPAIGAVIPVEGEMREIVTGAGRSARLVAGRIEVPEGPRLPVQVATLLKGLARERLVARADHHAAELGRGYGKITLRDTRSRWGSCSSAGNLMFSWRLIMAPPQVLDYVAAHEVAHLARMDHSPAFWAICARLCPGYEAHKAWLKAHGAGLQAWRFESLP